MTMLSRRHLLQAAALAIPALSFACASDPVAADAEAPTHPLSGLTDFAGLALVTDPIVPILGRPATVIDFWASWCGPCRMAFPHLDQLYRTFKADGLDMVGICVDDDPLAGKRFWAQRRPRFPVAWDANSEVRDRFGVISLPTTVLLDRNGSIVVRSTGFDPGEHRYLEEQVRRLVAI